MEFHSIRDDYEKSKLAEKQTKPHLTIVPKETPPEVFPEGIDINSPHQFCPIAQRDCANCEEYLGTVFCIDAHGNAKNIKFVNHCQLEDAPVPVILPEAKPPDKRTIRKFVTQEPQFCQLGQRDCENSASYPSGRGAFCIDENGYLKDMSTLTSCPCEATK